MNPTSRTPPAPARWQPVPSFQADETGATAVEYGLIGALIALTLLGALKALGVDMAELPIQSIIDAMRSVLS